MKKLNLLIILLSLILIAGCNPCQTKKITTTLNQHTHLSDLSSASAAWYHNEQLYVAGDDVPWLFQLDNQLQINNKVRLSNIDSLVNGRTPGAIKADFESMEFFEMNGEEIVLVLPSGSRELTRDTAYLVSLKGEKTIYKANIRRLFNKIISRAGIPSGELNIEGLAIDKKNVFLLQRGNVTHNFIIRIPRREFFNYFRHHTILPDFTVYPFELPQNNGVSAGFSGACILPDQSGLLFTASLENTGSALMDGEVTGSYIGYIPFCKLSKGEFTCVLFSDKGKPFAKKLEGITIKNDLGDGHYDVITVSDNDDGTSDIIELTIDLK